MPSIQSLPTRDLYFKSLEELDAYRTKRLSERFDLSQTFRWIPRRTVAHGVQGRLLVCHDYKGGYTESPLSLSYTFNYWSLCDTFIYFSHHRITIPPPGWVNASHRQGVKMLGTIIFEGGAEPDCLRLLVGKLPSSITGPAFKAGRPGTLSVSPHYAIALAELAQERGFDGYLLNFECPLQGGLEQTRSLAAWITLLQSELIKRVGPHAKTIWYDSVIFTGQLAWQDRLNSFNLPFFIPSTDFFSNYTWPSVAPNKTAQYFLNLDANLLGDASDSKPKTLQDVYMGVDVWGRGSHGGGGFGCYKAIEHVSPDSLGLSVALFGQAWTWETEEAKPEWTWDYWWQYERNLWVGSPDANAIMSIPKDPRNPGCPHGPFRPFSSFFPRLPPPDPADLPFHTTFCPGVGYSWFVAGTRVFQNAQGWTDIDKQTTMGDLLWPRPELKWETDNGGTLPLASPSVHMEDGWGGGSSIKLDFGEQKQDDELAFRSFWLPIQTLSLTTQKSYTASLVYKILSDHDSIDLDFALSVRTLRGGTCTSEDIDSERGSEPKAEIVPDSVTSIDVSKGWVKISLQFIIHDTPPSTISIESAIGLVITTVSEDPTIPFSLSILLGQINVYPTPPSTIEPNTPQILWVDHTTILFPTSSPSSDKTTQTTATSTANPTEPPTQTITQITWQPATSLKRVDHIAITSPDDPQCVWTPQPSLAQQHWFPEFVYFNIYAAPQDAAVHWHGHQQASGAGYAGATWIGTSGANGSVGQGKLAFAFDRGKLPESVKGLSKIRVFVQGVLDTGEILEWGKCAYVDIP